MKDLISDTVTQFSQQEKAECEAFMLFDDYSFSLIDISEIIVCISRGHAIKLY